MHADVHKQGCLPPCRSPEVQKTFTRPLAREEILIQARWDTFWHLHQFQLTSTTTQGCPEARLSFTSKMASVPPLTTKLSSMTKTFYPNPLFHINLFYLKQERDHRDAKTPWSRIHYLLNKCKTIPHIWKFVNV